MKEIFKRPFVYIATLGNAPQVVTIGLDQLLLTYPFVELCVIHTDDRPDVALPKMKFSTMYQTVQTLDAEFLNKKLIETSNGEQAWDVDYKANDQYYRFRYRRVRIQREVQESGQLVQYEPIQDVETEVNSQAAFRTIFRTVKRYKEQRAIVHFNLSGGRKSMSVFAMSAAQLLFTAQDQLWHVVSQYEFMHSKAMHDSEDHSRLVPIPHVSVASINPVLGMLISSNDPYDIVQAQENYLQLIDLQRKEKFLRDLNVSERQILVGVTQGLSNEEIGKRLKKSLAGKTVANKLTDIYELYKVFMMDGITAVSRPNHEHIRTFLATEFGAYFQQRGESL